MAGNATPADENGMETDEKSRENRAHNMYYVNIG